MVDMRKYYPASGMGHVTEEIDGKRYRLGSGGGKFPQNTPLGGSVDFDVQAKNREYIENQNEQAERASAKAMDEQGLLKPHEKQMAVNQWGPFWKDVKAFGSKVGGVLSDVGSGVGEGVESMLGKTRQDPNLALAMAMAGFSMADPDSGFTNNPRDPYSAFRALKSGLGSGLQTYAQLSKPRELGFAEQERIKNMYKLQQIEAESKYGKGMGEYRRVLQHLRLLEQQNPDHPDIPLLKAKLDAMTRVDPSSKMKNFQFKRGLRKKNDPTALSDWEGEGPKGFSIDLGGEKKIISPSGEEKFSAPVTLKETEKVPYIEKTTEVKKTAAIRAEEIAKTRLALPDSIEAHAYMMELLDKAINHEGMPQVIGVPNVLTLGGLIPATAGADFRTVYDQIKGKQFMEAYKTLKGGGQITEIEGNKATEAMARMGKSQSEVAFVEALNELKDVITKVLARQKAFAAQEISPKRRKNDRRNKSEGFTVVED